MGAAPAQPQATESAPPAQAKPLTRADLAKQIWDTAQSLNMDRARLTEYVKEDYGKTLAQMTDAEMHTLFEALQMEQGRKGA